MNTVATRCWLVIVFLSIVIMWILELNGTIPNILQKEKMEAMRKKQEETEDRMRRVNSMTPIHETLDDLNLADASKEKDPEYFIKLNGFYLGQLEKAHGDSTKANIPSSEKDLEEPLRIYVNEQEFDSENEEREKLDKQEQDKQETSRIFRSLRVKRQSNTTNPSTNSTSNSTSGNATAIICDEEKVKDACINSAITECQAKQPQTQPSPGPPTPAPPAGRRKKRQSSGAAGPCDKSAFESDCILKAKRQCSVGGSDDSSNRQKCNPIAPRGQKPKSFDPVLPPCRLFATPEIEPIPAHLYEGKLEFGEPCWPLYQVADEQAKGIPDYPPETEKPELSRGRKNKYKNVNAGVEKKANEIDKETCIVSKGLECIEYDDVDEIGNQIKVGKCGCMSAFGGKPEHRLIINETCYIPAEAGDMSACFGDLGIPLPSGDTYNKNEWNTVKLECAPGSVCITSSKWTEKRCTCKKGFTLHPENGTCSFAISIWAHTSSTIGVYQFILTIVAAVTMIDKLKLN